MVEDSIEQKECDIIMKGGITSGVVYPKTIIRMSKYYRFRSIGGTSAGAIAAVITAAAEYNRDGGGFTTIASLPGEVQERLLTFFQPSPKFRSIFSSALLFMSGRNVVAIGNLLAAKWLYVSGGVVSGVVFAIASAESGSYLAALLLLLIGTAIGFTLCVYVIVKTTLRDLAASDFGFCPGPTQSGQDKLGLSDWLAEKIEVAAGRMPAGGAPPASPLTFNDIWFGKNAQGTQEKPAVDLRMMTTNLSLRRPHALPNMDRNHFFKEEEFRRLLPGWVVDYMIKKPNDVTTDANNADSDHASLTAMGYHPFPTNGELPLVVAARMSLSFPILFSAVPLYRRDFPHEQAGAPPQMQRMLFSDGGLSSNFPVHFFDTLLPNRPTFGISLEAFDERDAGRRVHLPMRAGGGIWLDYSKIEHLTGFLMSLVNAAKDWQDRLQSTLPGYRERIASVYLKDDEGGSNLTMGSDTIENLVDLGDRAGALMTGTPLSSDDQQAFDFNDHRWRRYLVAFARLEETMEQAAWSWYDSSGPTKVFIQEYMKHPASYHSSSPQWRQAVFERFDGIMAIAKKWDGTSLRDAEPGYIPKPRTTLRITPVS